MTALPIAVPAARRRSASASSTFNERAGVRDELRCSLGDGRAGVDDGDVDAVPAELVGEVLGERDDADVAGGGDEVPAGARREAGDVDDPPPALGDQVGDDGPGGAQVPEDLDVDGVEELLVGGLRRGDRAALPARHRRVVDEDVDAAELLADRVDGRPDRRVVAGVELRGGDPAGWPSAGQLRGGLGEPFRVAGGDGDVGAFGEQRTGDAQPDARLPPVTSARLSVRWRSM